MKHFLRTEWKTLVVIALVALAVYVVSRREEAELEQQRRGPGIAESATVVPGERLGSLTLELDALERQLGTPTRVEKVEPGLEARHFEPLGVTLFVRGDGTLAAVSSEVPLAPSVAEDLIAPNGQSLLTHWSRASGSLGQVIAHQRFSDGRVLWRLDGLLLELESVDKVLAPVRVTLLPRMPETLVAAHRR